MRAGRARGGQPRFGDVVEIETSKGLAYAQYTHRHPTLGALIRVLPGFYAERPASLAEVVRRPEAFRTFYPLAAALRQGVVRLAGHEEIPPDAVSFPVMRKPGPPDLATRRVTTWRIWDGQRESPPRELTPEVARLPIAAVWNHTLLAKRIEEGWTPGEGM